MQFVKVSNKAWITLFYILAVMNLLYGALNDSSGSMSGILGIILTILFFIWINKRIGNDKQHDIINLETKAEIKKQIKTTKIWLYVLVGYLLITFIGMIMVNELFPTFNGFFYKMPIVSFVGIFIGTKAWVEYMELDK
ncbi:MAG: hypothetical protein ACRDDL_08570 [Sarcina sp.]